MSFSKYIIKLSTTLLIPYIIGLIVLLFILPQYYFAAYPFIILLFIAIGLPFYKLLKLKQQNKQNHFYKWFMMNTIIKLFISLITILLYTFLVKAQVISFIVVYFVFYAVLSVFEIKMFSKNIKSSE